MGAGAIVKEESDCECTFNEALEVESGIGTNEL